MDRICMRICWKEDLRGIEKIRKCSDFAEMYDAADRFVWKTLSRKK